MKSFPFQVSRQFSDDFLMLPTQRIKIKMYVPLSETEVTDFDAIGVSSGSSSIIMASEIDCPAFCYVEGIDI